MTLCDIVRHLPRSFESDDCRSKFNSMLHTENYNVSCGFSAICVEFSDTQSQPVATRQPVHSPIRPAAIFWPVTVSLVIKSINHNLASRQAALISLKLNPVFIQQLTQASGADLLRTSVCLG